MSLSLTSQKLYVSTLWLLYLTQILLQDEATLTRNMLCNWTGIDIDGSEGSKMNTPANAICLNINDLSLFGSFDLYFDKDAVSLLVVVICHSRG